MTDLPAVDRLEVLVLVDNMTDSLSTNPEYVVPEWMGLLTAGRLEQLSGRATCCAHHGLSLLLTAYVGNTRHTLLFDTGPDGDIFLRNAKILGIDLSSIDTVVLSHGHWDHAGGLDAAITAISSRCGSHKVDCFVNPGMLRERAIQRPNGQLLQFESVPEPSQLSDKGAHVINSPAPHSIGGAFWLSGDIPRVTQYEIGFPGHVQRSVDGRSWEPDPLLMDERFISVHVKDKGQIVFSACSHAGIVNVLMHARSMFPSVPLYGVVGGLHLSGTTERIIPETIADLRQFGLKLLAPGHCTGWRALSAMTTVFREELIPSAVGKRYIF